MKRIFWMIFILFFTSEVSLIAQDSTQELVGDVIQLALPSIALGSTFIWKDEDQATMDCFKSLALSFGTVYSLKRIINKRRPNGMNFGFPSDHSSSAFTGAAFIQRRYGWGFGTAAYLLARFTGFMRVEALKHDYWDVCAGASIGILSAYVFTKKI